MSSKLYVGNLPYDIENVDLENLFSTNGSVQTVNIVKDRDTGRAKGFAFVEMKSQQEATKAIENLNDKDFRGRPLKVNLANNDYKRNTTRSRY